MNMRLNHTPWPCLMALAALATALLVSGCNKSVTLPPPAAVVTPPAAVAGMAEVAGVDITSNVSTALLGATELQGKPFTVVTTRGDVRLTAVLDNQNQIDTAMRLARAAQGVHAVHDELTLKP